MSLAERVRVPAQSAWRISRASPSAGKAAELEALLHLRQIQVSSGQLSRVSNTSPESACVVRLLSTSDFSDPSLQKVEFWYYPCRSIWALICSPGNVEKELIILILNFAFYYLFSVDSEKLKMLCSTVPYVTVRIKLEVICVSFLVSRLTKQRIIELIVCRSLGCCFGKIWAGVV